MDQKFLIVANWKSNSPKSWDIVIPEQIEVVVAPPFPMLSKLKYPLCAQDVSTFDEGPFTGETSAKLLKDLGVKYCLVGHSERRKYFKETNDQIQQKISRLLENDIVPIICAQSFEEIPANPQGCLIMYEPFSAISTEGQYHSETPEKIDEILSDWKTKLPENTRFLYGGSVNPENSQSLVSNIQNLSGFVVGNASLNPAVFSQVIDSVLKTQ